MAEQSGMILNTCDEKIHITRFDHYRTTAIQFLEVQDTLKAGTSEKMQQFNLWFLSKKISAESVCLSKHVKTRARKFCIQWPQKDLFCGFLPLSCFRASFTDSTLSHNFVHVLTVQNMGASGDPSQFPLPFLRWIWGDPHGPWIQLRVSLELQIVALCTGLYLRSASWRVTSPMAGQVTTHPKPVRIVVELNDNWI